MTGRQRWTIAAAVLAVIWVVVYWWSPPGPPEPLEIDPAAYGAPIVDTPPDASSRTPVDSPELVMAPPPQRDDAPASERTIIPPPWDSYTVQAGDTLQTIARDRFGSVRYWKQIARLNGDAVDPIRLRAGQVIKIPRDLDNIQGVPVAAEEDEHEPAEETGTGDDPTGDEEALPIVYVVREGDTLSAIAGRLYGRTALWTLIQQANQRTVDPDGRNLRPGMELVIPPAPAR